jgi:hypothetical protein
MKYFKIYFFEIASLIAGRTAFSPLYFFASLSSRRLHTAFVMMPPAFRYFLRFSHAFARRFFAFRVSYQPFSREYIFFDIFSSILRSSISFPTILAIECNGARPIFSEPDRIDIDYFITAAHCFRRLQPD